MGRKLTQEAVQLGNRKDSCPATLRHSHDTQYTHTERAINRRLSCLDLCRGEINLCFAQKFRLNLGGKKETLLSCFASAQHGCKP
ncbi:hypothetical protein PoB_002238800 [Plakobranchus ocellatus]|uniref:Uncharacterized protein n=1 Tax=Plakobranchus ocellatus TaxID=259542 RepID=A0AAV3ZM09_9GAST|nr:hypothetical protein PoB_002238800 [Plakobranchus ocellatus]